MSAPTQGPGAAQPWKPDFGTPEEAYAEGFKDVVGSAHRRAIPGGKGMEQVLEVAKDQYDPYHSAVVKFQRVSSDSGPNASKWGAWQIVESDTKKTLTRLPTNMDEIRADPEMSDAYDMIMKGFAEHAMQQFIQHSGKRAKEFGKPHQ